MKRKRIIYFVTKSSSAIKVLKEALDRSALQDIAIFFDLDGSRVLDRDYAGQLFDDENNDFLSLIEAALHTNIQLFGCQLNVMTASGFHIVDGVQSVGVVTFLEHAYKADAVLSY